MPRIRQKEHEYRAADFRRAVEHGCIDRGLDSKKALAEAAGIPYATLWKRLQDPDGMTVDELRRVVKAAGLPPEAVLELMSYQKREIMRLVERGA